MRSALWLALAAAVTPGCRQVFGIDPPRLAGDSGTGDGSDSSGPPGDASFCYGPAAFPLCFDTAPTGDPPPGSTLNTTTSSSCMEPLPASWTAAGQPDVCLIAVGDLTISSNLRVTGARPLVIVAAATITVLATLDASAHGTTPGGPGSGSIACANNLNGGNTMTSGVGGGGAGGSLGTPGGNGGAGTGSAGEACPASPAQTPLRGGANGGTGGYAQLVGGNPPIGLGGGAVFFAAGTSITISGAINASGGGGGGGTYYAGGAGGGAGGTIAIYAPTITAFGTLMTNGGGGGTPGTNDASTGYGADPSLGSPYAGGAGGTISGRPDGGTGCGHGSPATIGSGGSGGGGGCGFVLSNQDLRDAIVSPGVTLF